MDGVEIMLPVDFVCSSMFGEDGEFVDSRPPPAECQGLPGLVFGPLYLEPNVVAIGMEGMEDYFGMMETVLM
eukprot:10473522-Alexandrium_andersonii.AAC.1